MKHIISVPRKHFEAISNGDKTFIITDNTDCDFQKGDVVELRELTGEKGLKAFTGATRLMEITYVTGSNQRDDYVVFSIRDVAGSN